MQQWFFPPPGEGYFRPPQNIEQVVEAQEAEINSRQTEMATIVQGLKPKPFHHIPTDLEEK
jgi:hypothetical protein